MENKSALAVFGVSQDSSKYGNKIFTTLLDKGFTVYGINPKGGVVNGKELYPSLAQVPARVHTAIMVVPPAALISAVEQCIESGVKEIWFQPGAQSADAFNRAEQAGLRAVNGCYMAANGLW